MPLQRRLAQLGVGKQSVKGTAGLGTYNFGLSEGVVIDAEPTDDDIALTWTSRSVEGHDRKFVKPGVHFGTVATPGVLGLLLLSALGADAVTGSGPYLHTMTPASDLPYDTFYGNYGGLFFQLNDSKVDELELTFDGAGRLMAKVTAWGCTPVPLGSTWTVGVPAERVSGGFMSGAGGLFQLEGVAASVQSGSVKFANHITPIPVANSVLPVDVFVGALDVTYSLKIIPDDLSRWRKVVFGGATGTVVAPAPYYGSVSLGWTMDANNDLTINAPRTKLATKFPDLNPAGGPAEITVEGKIAMPASGAQVTALLHNSVASY